MRRGREAAAAPGKAQQRARPRRPDPPDRAAHVAADFIPRRPVHPIRGLRS